jgi:hypothetical protein
VINPLVGVGFIDRNDFGFIRLGKRYLKMQRPSSPGKTQQQGAGRIFILRVVFDYLRADSRLANFLLGDIPLHNASKCMPAEFIFSGN